MVLRFHGTGNCQPDPAGLHARIWPAWLFSMAPAPDHRGAQACEMDAVAALRRSGLRTATKNNAGYAYAQGSEEHTSELQSLMRTSYAVFCFKKTQKTPQP